MSIITIDFETFYDKDYSLSKMTTEEYVNDPRFEVIGVGLKIDDEPTKWLTDGYIDQEFADTDWSQHAVLCHNTLFDGYILSKKYGVKPGFWFDTLSMARAIHGVEAGVSLAKLATRYGLGEKGNEVVQALGKNRSDFSAGDLDRYGAYCRNDCDLTHALFNILAAKFPENELKLIDLTIRMFTEQTLMVDENLLVERLADIKNEKSITLQGLMESLNVQTEQEVSKILGSGPKFADVLRKYGAIVPMKESPTTGKLTYAFAKTDPGFIELQEDENPFIQQLCAVRLGTKSTMEESRIERFIGIGRRNGGYLPVPLRYYGAHTGRWAGLDSVNFQNLPSRNKKKKALKNSIMAPPGYVVINCDSSQIEARILAWLAGQLDLLQAFRERRDVYSEFASKVFGRPVTKKDEKERFLGKTCILGLGYGTGAKKLRHTLAMGGVDMTAVQCKEIVDLYRREYSWIPKLWDKYDMALGMMVGDPDNKLELPNGLYIRYNNLRISEGKYVYDSRSGPKNLWGGAMVENMDQALARIIIGEQMIRIAERYRIALTVHDSVVAVVPEDEAKEAIMFMVEVMSNPPAWAPDLPLACEAKFHRSYGECG